MHRALGAVAIGLILSISCGSAALAQVDRSAAPTKATTTAVGSTSRHNGNNYWGLLGLLGLLGFVGRNKAKHVVHPHPSRPAPRTAYSDSAIAKLRAADAAQFAVLAQRERTTQAWPNSLDIP